MINKIIHDDEQSRKDFESYLEVWEKSASVKDFDKIDTDKDWQKVRSKMHFNPSRKKIPVRNYFLRIAAILILALGLTFFFVQLIHRTHSHPLEYYQTATQNTTKEIGLPDGTMITLNKNSKIIRNSDYGKKNRDVILEGEAFFKVAKNPNLPFRVYSSNSTVEVLGTTFNINASGKQVVVGVVTGHVAFYETGNSKNGVDLVPNNLGIYKTESNSFTKKENIDVGQFSWKDVNTSFHKVPIKLVFQTLADHYNKKLVMGDNINEIVGNIDLNQESLEESLQIIRLAFPTLEIKEENDKIVVAHR